MINKLASLTPILLALIIIPGTVPVAAKSKPKSILMGKIKGPASHTDLFKSTLLEGLVASKLYRVIDRDDLEDALAEQKLSKSKLSEDEAIINLKLADYKLKGSVKQIEEGRFTVSVKIIDLESLEVTYTKSVDYEDVSFIKKVARYIINDMTKKLKAENKEKSK